MSGYSSKMSASITLVSTLGTNLGNKRDEQSFASGFAGAASVSHFVRLRERPQTMNPVLVR